MTIGGSIRINTLGLTVASLSVLGALWYCFGVSSKVSYYHGPKPEDAGLVSVRQLLAVSLEAARRGGREVKRVREAADIGEKSKGKTREGANNPVTDGDVLSHRIMYYSILKAFPKLSIISEENDPQPVDMKEIPDAPLNDPEIDKVVPDEDDVFLPIEDVDVWIDPLDATQEYTESLLHYVTTMVCVAVRGRAVAGVIHKPFEGDKGVSAWAWAGPKSFIGETLASDLEWQATHKKRDLVCTHYQHYLDLKQQLRRIMINIFLSLDQAHSRLIVSRSHAGKVHDVAEEAFGPNAKVTPAGGAGFKSWEVVRGEQDAYVHVTLIKKWDICPGDAILKAAGGTLTTLDGRSIDYSGGPRHEEKNEGGVLATMHDHDAFVAALKTR